MRLGNDKTFLATYFGAPQGNLLERLWVLFGASWAALGDSWAAFGNPKLILVASCKLLGASKGSWIDLGTIIKAKMEAKSVFIGGQNQVKIQPRFTQALKQQ